jgi:chromosome segregation ATPase
MKNVIKFLVFIGIMYFVIKSCSFGDLFSDKTSEETVTLGKDELATSLDENDQLASEVTDLRKELFSILVAMNSITDDALTMERNREGGGNNGESVTQQIHAKMNALRDQLEEARRKAGKSEELQDEIDRLERSLFEKEREVRRLSTSIAIVDDEIEETIKELEKEVDKLSEKESDIRNVNNQKIAAMNEKTAVDQQAWINAGNEMVKAARTIPRPHSSWNDGEQSRAIVKAKQLLLKSAQEDCYHVAIRINRGTSEAHEAIRLTNEAHLLFEKATRREDIGESTVMDED